MRWAGRLADLRGAHDGINKMVILVHPFEYAGARQRCRVPEYLPFG